MDPKKVILLIKELKRQKGQIYYKKRRARGKRYSWSFYFSQVSLESSQGEFRVSGEALVDCLVSVLWLYTLARAESDHPDPDIEHYHCVGKKKKPWFDSSSQNPSIRINRSGALILISSHLRGREKSVRTAPQALRGDLSKSWASFSLSSSAFASSLQQIDLLLASGGKAFASLSCMRSDLSISMYFWAYINLHKWIINRSLDLSFVDRFRCPFLLQIDYNNIW